MSLKEITLQEAIDVLPYPLYIIDINNYKIEACNKSLGIDLSEGEYMCHKVAHKNDRPCSGENDPCPISEIKKSKKPVSVEHVHYDKNGKSHDVRVHAFPIFGEDGEIEKIVEYVIDITKEKETEKVLEEREENLRKMNELMMGRELKMKELERELEALKK